MSSLMSFSWQLSVTALSPPCVAAAAVCPSRYLPALPRCVATSRQAGRVAVRGAARPPQLVPGSECARTFAPRLATLPTPCPRRSHPYGRCSARAAAWPRAQLRALPGYATNCHALEYPLRTLPAPLADTLRCGNATTVALQRRRPLDWDCGVQARIGAHSLTHCRRTPSRSVRAGPSGMAR